MNLQPKHLQSSALPGWASRAFNLYMFISLCEKIMEILGLDPKITICKIAVLPVKLYPLFTKKKTFIFVCFFNPLGVRTRDVTVKALCLNLLTSGSKSHKNYNLPLEKYHFYPRNDFNVYDMISINLKFILSTSSSTRTLITSYNL